MGLSRASGFEEPQHLKLYAPYCNQVRSHLSLDNDTPDFRGTQKIGHIAAIPILGGLHHQYVNTFDFRS
jgi:hypothetical protein